MKSDIEIIIESLRNMAKSDPTHKWTVAEMAECTEAEWVYQENINRQIDEERGEMETRL